LFGEGLDGFGRNFLGGFESGFRQSEYQVLETVPQMDFPPAL
jgi:hypothetical protein